jgi:ABC-2 type transport system permease protein
MRAIWLIARRELASYLRTMSGYVIIAAVLFLLGLSFNAFVLSGPDQRSSEVLSQFFYLASGFTITASVFLSMRLLAEEHQRGTVTLLLSSPVRDFEIVAGKYLAAMIFLGLFLAASLCMPALILVNGKVSAGHLVAGYLGLMLIGSATMAIGTFGSALAKHQLLAVILNAVMTVGLIVTWLLARVTSPPFSDIFSAMSLHQQHFPPFQSGIVHVRDVVYYLMVTYLGLFAATRVLEARRWR